MSEEKERDDADHGDDRKNWLEWLFVAAGALTVVALLGYLGWSAFQHDAGPPDLVPMIVGESDTMSGRQYRVRVRNLGGSAEYVHVELCDATSQCATHTFRFLPIESSREALFTIPSPTDPIEVRIVSYSEM